MAPPSEGAVASASGQRRETTFVRSMAAGATAACSATVVFHPLDTAKTVLQHGNGGAGAHSLLLITLRKLGLRGLYRGVMPAAFSMAPACAVRMGTYETCKDRLLARPPIAGMAPGVSIATASALSVVMSALVRSPLDMVKTQLQTGSEPSTAAALQAAWGRGGLAGLYRGAGLALMRDVPFFSINLVLYEQLRATAAIEKRKRSDGLSLELTTFEGILTGGVSQGMAGLCTNPIDVLKTRVQAGPDHGGGAVLGALQSVLREPGGGVSGLMRGALMRVAWIAPQGCVYYPIYEYAQRLNVAGKTP